MLDGGENWSGLLHKGLRHYGWQVGDIISRFERKGFALKGLKLFQTPKELAEVRFLPTCLGEGLECDMIISLCWIEGFSTECWEVIGTMHAGLCCESVIASFCWIQEHYGELKEKPFYGKLVQYIVSGPVVCMVCSPLCILMLEILWLKRRTTHCLLLSHRTLPQ